MDLPTVCIGIAICLLSALLIYIISAFSMREKTFEEVIAEQKRREEQEREKARNDKRAEKEHIKKRFKNVKKGKDKSKDKTGAVTEPQPEPVESKMVNLEIEPDIIEPVAVEQVSTAPKKTATKTKKKSILVNKDEKPAIKDDKDVEEMHFSKLPKDEVEMKHVHEEIMVKSAKVAVQQSKPPKKSVEAKNEKNSQDLIISKKETKQEQIILEKRQESVPLEEKKFSKVRNAGADKSSLIETIKSVALSDNELQTLIEILLNRQGGALPSTLEWNKKSQKGDPVAQMRKQLEEKERALQEEQNMAMSANAKVKEVKQELSQEKVKFTTVQKQYQDKISLQSQEITALHSKMSQTHEQHLIETSQMQARIQQLEGQVGEKGRLHKLIEENKVLKDSLSKAQNDSVNMSDFNNMKQKVQIMEQELSNNAIKLNASENSKKPLEQKIKQYEEKIHQLEESQVYFDEFRGEMVRAVCVVLKASENTKKTFEEKITLYEDKIKELEAGKGEGDTVLAKKVEEISVHLRKEEAKNKTLEKDLNRTNKELVSAEGELKSWKQKLEELEKKLTHTDDASRALDTKLKDSERTKSDLEGNVQNLERQLSCTKDKNTDLEKKIQDVERAKSDLEGNIQNLEKQLSCTKEKNTELETKVMTVSQEMQSLKDEANVVKETSIQSQSSAKLLASQNGDISQEDSSDKITIVEHEKLITEKGNEINKLRAELDKNKLTYSNLEGQLETQMKKNNELREKNWKAMEALEKAEKSVSEKVQTAIKSEKENKSSVIGETESIARNTFKRLFPDVAVKDSLHYKDWLSDFEIEAKSYLATLSSKSAEQLSDVDIKLKHSSEENTKLQTQVQQYRNVLSETEEKLTQLQKSVESEEIIWQEKLHTTESDLNQSKQEVLALKDELKKHHGSTEMEDRIEELKGELERVEFEKKENIDKFETRIVELEKKIHTKEESHTVIEKHLHEKEQQILVFRTEVEKLKKSDEDLEALRRLIAELKKQLEDEKRKSNELASNNVKLNGIIKTGQDSLREEQKIVSKLQDQIETLSTSSTSSQNLDITELKAKLSEKEGQLEKEMQRCNQLNQQLASKGTDSGTSV